jgi:hypothetical protein
VYYGCRGRDDEVGNAEREKAQRDVDVVEKVILELYALFKKVEQDWASMDSCVLGHVLYSLSILLGAGTADEQYTRGYAIIEVDKGKINRTKFNGLIDFNDGIVSGVLLIHSASH